MLLNGIVQRLRAHYDVVVHCDVDEIVVPDRRCHASLAERLAVSTEGVGFFAGVGIELLHDVRREAPLVLTRPLFEQRRAFRHRFRYYEPHVVSGPGTLTTHGCDAAFALDPDLYHVHLKHLDRDAVVARQARVRGLYDQGLGGRKSRWRLDQAEMSAEFDGFAALPVAEERPEHRTLLRCLFGAPGPIMLPMCDGERHNKALKHLPPSRVRRLEGRLRRLPRRFASVETLGPALPTPAGA